MSRNLVHTSKFLSYVLRHNPDSIGLSIDPRGWANIDELIGKARNQGRDLNHTLIAKIAYESDKSRFELSDDGKFIRASYGHSIPIQLEYKARVPPRTLYHGTARNNVTSIREQGIHAGGRQFVHLSPDRDSALEVGQRHGKPVILTIQSRQMYENGHDFYPTTSEVWLTRFVPPDFID